MSSGDARGAAPGADGAPGAVSPPRDGLSGGPDAADGPGPGEPLVPRPSRAALPPLPAPPVPQLLAPTSLLSELGHQITSIVTPVSICMACTVALVRVLNPSGSSDPSAGSLTHVFYDERPDASAGANFAGAVANALAFVATVAASTFALVCLYKRGLGSVVVGYMTFACFSVFFFLVGILVLQVLQTFHADGVDVVTYAYLLFNFAAVGSLTTFFFPAPLLLRQSYLVATSVATAYAFTWTPAWTTWVLLVAMALYDLAAVLAPGGPLRELVELAEERGEAIPALVYSARARRSPAQGARGGRGGGNRAAAADAQSAGGGRPTPTEPPPGHAAFPVRPGTPAPGRAAFPIRPGTPAPGHAAFPGAPSEPYASPAPSGGAAPPLATALPRRAAGAFATSVGLGGGLDLAALPVVMSVLGEAPTLCPDPSAGPVGPRGRAFATQTQEAETEEDEDLEAEETRAEAREREAGNGRARAAAASPGSDSSGVFDVLAGAGPADDGARGRSGERASPSRRQEEVRTETKGSAAPLSRSKREDENGAAVASLSRPKREDENGAAVASLSRPKREDENGAAVASLSRPKREDENGAAVASLSRPKREDENGAAVASLSRPKREDENGAAVASLLRPKREDENGAAVASLSRPKREGGGSRLEAYDLSPAPSSTASSAFSAIASSAPRAVPSSIPYRSPHDPSTALPPVPLSEIPLASLLGTSVGALFPRQRGGAQETVAGDPSPAPSVSASGAAVAASPPLAGDLMPSSPAPADLPRPRTLGERRADGQAEHRRSRRRIDLEADESDRGRADDAAPAGRPTPFPVFDRPPLHAAFQLPSSARASPPPSTGSASSSSSAAEPPTPHPATEASRVRDAEDRAGSQPQGQLVRPQRLVDGADAGRAPPAALEPARPAQPPPFSYHPLASFSPAGAVFEGRSEARRGSGNGAETGAEAGRRGEARSSQGAGLSPGGTSSAAAAPRGGEAVSPPGAMHRAGGPEGTTRDGDSRRDRTVERRLDRDSCRDPTAERRSSRRLARLGRSSVSRPDANPAAGADGLGEAALQGSTRGRRRETPGGGIELSAWQPRWRVDAGGGGRAGGGLSRVPPPSLSSPLSPPSGGSHPLPPVVPNGGDLFSSLPPPSASCDRTASGPPGPAPGPAGDDRAARLAPAASAAGSTAHSSTEHPHEAPHALFPPPPAFVPHHAHPPGGSPAPSVSEDLPDGIKLGLGDFIFYSVLVGRAAMYDWLAVAACWIAIVAGLGCTLAWLAIARHALPALPVSIALAVLFYFVTRFVLEPALLPLTVATVYV